ncbi:MAG: tetratricopeptide repeat protein [Candidatus Hermodarchaeota archaeon]
MTRSKERMFEQVEQHLRKGENHEALHLVEVLEKHPKLTEEERIECKIHRLWIYWQTGLGREIRLLLADEVFQAGQAMREPLYMIDALLIKGKTLSAEKRNEDAFELMLQAETLVDSLLEQSDRSSTKATKADLLYRKAELVMDKGYHELVSGDKDSAVEQIEYSRKIFERQNHHRLLDATGNIGFGYEFKGDIKNAMKYYEEAIKLSEEFENKPGQAIWLSMLARLHRAKGEIGKACEVSEQALQLAKESQSRHFSGILVFNGEIYRSLGDYQKAKERIQQGLEIEETTPTFTGNILRDYGILLLLEIAFDQHNVEEVNQYLNHLEGVCGDDYAKLWNSQRYRYAKARLLETSQRLRDRGRAQELFEQVVNEDVTDSQVTLSAMLHLSSLLLSELRLTGNPTVFKEVQDLLGQLQDIAQSSGSVWLLAKSHVLRARLVLLEMDFKAFRDHLTKAQVIAQDYQMGHLADQITKEYDILMERLERWEEFITHKASVEERADILQVEALVTRMIYVRGTNLEDPLIRANVTAPESFAANEEIRIAIDLINIGRKPGLAMRIEQLLPPQFTLIETQPEYSAEGGSLILDGILLGPMQTASLSLRVRIEGVESIQFSPQVIFANLQGDFEVSHANAVNLKPLLTFTSEHTRDVFDYLVKAFRHDHFNEGIREEDSGWRIRTQLLNDMPQLNRWQLYGLKKKYGSILTELLQQKVVEVITEVGKRGRKGRQTKLRVALDHEVVKQYIQRK